MVKCLLCGQEMPHISLRHCKCHSKMCVRYSDAIVKGHCTMHRKLSNSKLGQIKKAKIEPK